MNTITTLSASGLICFAIPLLAKLAAHLAYSIDKQEKASKATGLSVTDISNASTRASAKGGLTIRKGAHLRLVVL